MNPRRLYRSSNDRWIGGVAAGVADYFDVDPVLIRILWLISIPFTAFLSIFAYIVMLIVVPEEPREWPQPSPWQPGGAPVGYGASYAQPTGPTGQPAGPTPADTNAPAQPAGPDATAGAGVPDATGAVAPGTTGAAAPGTVPPTQGWDAGWTSRQQDRWQRRADRWQQRMDRRERGGSGGLVFGALLILVGGLLAWHTIFPATDLSLVWPIAIVAFGIFLVATSIDYHRGQ